MFSKAAEYGLRAMLYIAEKSLEGRKVSVKEIGAAIQVPEPFTAKVLQSLAKDGLLSSTKGLGGGFSLTERQFNKNLLHVVKAIDGDALFTGCALGLNECSHKTPCPLHDTFASIRQQIITMMEEKTLLEMAHALKEGSLRIMDIPYERH